MQAEVPLPPFAAFDYHPRTQLVFGPGCVGRVGELARSLGAKRVLLVTDAGLVIAGHAARVEHALQAAGLGAVTYDRVRENPTTRDGPCPLCILHSSFSLYGMTFNSRRALIINCDATAARSRPMMRVVIFMAMGLIHFAPLELSRSTT